MEERKVGRLPLGLSAQMSSDHLDPCRVVIRDLSNLGCRVLTSQKPVVGTLVTIALKHFTEINGWVAWAKSGDIGIDFGSCPTEWCSFGVAASISGQAGIGQAAIAGSVTAGSSLNCATLSSVM